MLRDTGRCSLVYGPRRYLQQLEHEVWVTEAELLLHGTFTYGVKVGGTTADGLLVRDGRRFWVEVDNESLTEKQLKDKWDRYGNVQDFILVICHTKRRLRLLIGTADRVRDVVLFTRFRWLESPWVQEPWIDRWCSRTGI